MIKRRIELVEVAPRDGLQGEPVVMATARKTVFIEKAIAAGVRRLEVASFVHPRKVPQMADAEALLEALPYPDGVSYIGLVLNERGLDRALRTPVHEIGMAVLATDTYNRRNQGVTTDESIAAWRKIAARSKAEGKRVTVMISSAFGCPFEGEVPVERVMEIAQQVMLAEPDELAVADSIGVAVPAQVTDIMGRLHDEFPDTPLRGHFHNTRNTGLANAQAAIDAGVAALDASIGGIGGCPFAPAATGNIPSEDLLYLLDRSGVVTGVRLRELMAVSDWLSAELGHNVPAMLPKAGAFPAS